VNHDFYKLKIALPVLIVVSIVSFYFSIYKPLRRATSTAQVMLGATSRQPASIPSVNKDLLVSEAVIKQVVAFETDLKVTCFDLLSDRMKSASVSSNHVVFKLGKCGSSDSIKNHKTSVLSIDLTNKTNGYKAHMFNLNNSDFNSDFIQLENGENLMEFNFSLNDGQKKTQIFKIDRIQ